MRVVRRTCCDVMRRREWLVSRRRWWQRKWSYTLCSSSSWLVRIVTAHDIDNGSTSLHGQNG